MPARPPSASEESPLARRRRQDRVTGLLVVSVAFTATLSISWWARLESSPEVSQPPPPASSAGLVGFPRVDPVQALEVVRQTTPRDQLRGIVAEGVAADGTVDASKTGRIRYVFQSPRGVGPQPPREEMGPPRQLYCGKQTVHVRETGIVVDPDMPAVTCPTVPVESLPDPRCGPKELWERAVAKGAKPDRLARVEYYRSRVGPAWRFTIPGSPVSFSLYGDCGRELPAHEATGSVR